MRFFGVQDHKNTTNCAKCGTAMTIITGAWVRTEVFIKKSKGCFQCRVCGRYVCYDCSDNTMPCKCGEKQWKERSYLP